MIKLTSTDVEYRISLPYEQRLRAKRVPGYRWNPDLKLWCFPKSLASKRALLSEFGPEELEGISEFESDDLTDTYENLVRANNDLIARTEELIASHERIIDLWNVAEKFGLPEECDLGEFLAFTKASYEGNSKHADLAVKLATREAQISSMASELAQMSESEETTTRQLSPETFNQVLIQRTVPFQDLPTVVKEFSFDARSALELQNYLVKTLTVSLGKIGERVGFADLIREAEEKGILSSSAARTCHSLRIQRNHFAHESVNSEEVFPRAMLCLSSFAIVYMDLLSNKGAL